MKDTSAEGGSMTRWLLVLALCGCATTPEPQPHAPTHRTRRSSPPPPSATGGRAPTAMERGVVDRLARDAEHIRGLTFRSPVNVEIQDPATIARYLSAELDDEDLTKATLVYGSLGLLDPGIDLRELLASVMSEQVLGFYDTQAHKLVLRDQVARMLLRSPSSHDAAEARVVIVHELVHALQDQQLGLGRLAAVERDSDADNALKSVVEGDATLAMIFYAASQARITPEEVLDGPLLDRAIADLSSPGGADALSRSPAILRFTLVVPYVAGVGFVRELYRAGGWSEVDRAFETLPASMEQVMHPRAYLQREQPDEIVLPSLPELEEAGLVMVDEDSLGELELGVFFGRHRPEEIDRVAAAGWGGDRLRVYRAPDGRGVAVWFTTWDDQAEASQAQAAAAEAPHLVLRRGRALLILRHLDASLQPSVVQAFEAFAASLPEHPPRSPSTITAHHFP